MPDERSSALYPTLWTWGVVAAAVTACLCLWRLQPGAGLHPPVEFGMAALDLAKAWLPEGIVLGIGAFFAHRIGRADDEPSAAMFPAVAIYLGLWLVIWGLAVFLPGWLLLGPLSDALKVARDVLLIGGLGGLVVSGGMAFLYGGLFCMAALAALIAAFACPVMQGLSLRGRADWRQLKPGPAFGKCLLILLLTGAAYWAWRGAWFFHGPEDGPFRIVPDAAGSVLLIGWCAWALGRSMRSERAPDLSRHRNLGEST